MSTQFVNQRIKSGLVNMDVVACICNPAKRRLSCRTVRVRIPSGERLLSRWVPIFKRANIIQYKTEPKLNRIVDWNCLSIEQSFINP